ncbi:FHL1 [Candida jiufengensis]|uniref:FHL1 n=1 Tax=Candida jiufengensis TaxID=497108 RepID=UPI0022250B93|nr:FHL1 [Candida jiufengensis]KAI5955877.1 FHL1 [Candida jiufengensis]
MSNANDSNNITLVNNPENNHKTTSFTQLTDPIVPSSTNNETNKLVKVEDPVESLMLDDDFNILFANSNDEIVNDQQQSLSQPSQTETETKNDATTTLQNFDLNLKESLDKNSTTISQSQTPNLQPQPNSQISDMTADINKSSFDFISTLPQQAKQDAPLIQQQQQQQHPKEKQVKIEEPKRISNSSSSSSIYDKGDLDHDVNQEEEEEEDHTQSRVSAYARLDFENNVFYVQTLQVILGRKSYDELQQSQVDVHLSEKKAISRKHAKIFYNFGSQQFEITVLGKNGAFVDEAFVEKGVTLPLINGVKIQIGDIPFSFILPDQMNQDIESQDGPKQFNPSDAINLKSNLFSKQPTPKNSPKKTDQQLTQQPGSASPTDPSTTLRKKSMSRRDSLLKIRTLSNARRTSTAANDELNQLLQDLGVTESIEEDSELLDAQIKKLLDEDNDLEGDVLKLSHFNESAIADDEEDFDLVKGIENEAKIEKEILDIDSNISQLNREIANLIVPQQGTTQQNQSLIAEKEQQRRGLEEVKQQKKDHISQSRSSFVKNAGPVRTTPLMGKPASIQPPASSSIYSRINGLDKTGLHFFPNAIPPPKPKLTVPVPLITSEPGAIRSRPPLRAITMRDSTLHSTFYYPKTLDQPTEFPKPKGRKIIPRKPSKRVYTIDEIPEQCRHKPNITLAGMVTNVLQTAAARNGLTINEITDAVKEVYPYYKYCQEGWQASISHCIKFTKIFKKIAKKGPEWLYTMDELYKNERETMKIKQREILAKAEAIRQEEFRQRQRLEVNQQFMMNRNFPQQPYPMKPYNNQVPTLPQHQQYQQSSPSHQTQLPQNMNYQPQQPRTNIPNGQQQYIPNNTQQQQPLKQNQSQPLKSTPNSTQPSTTQPKSQPSMSDPDTQKSLEYLRKELFTLYKSRNLTYDKTIATTLITKSLATTIAQVNSIGAKVGAGDNALSFLVEKAPQQVSKILDIALSKSIKDFEGGNKSGAGTPSKASTPIQAKAIPVTTGPSTTLNQTPPLQQLPIQTQPKLSTNNTVDVPQSTPYQPIPKPQQPQQVYNQAPPLSTSQPIPQTQPITHQSKPQLQNSSPPPQQPLPQNNQSTITSTQSSPTTSASTPKQFSPSPQPSTTNQTKIPLSRPPSFGKPPNLKGNSLGRPGSYARPQSFGKPPGLQSGGGLSPSSSTTNLSRPAPTFLSNKPTFGSSGIKRGSESAENNDHINKKINL